MTKDNEINQTPENRPMYAYQEDMDDEINLIDLIYPIYKRRKFLISFCLGIAIVVGIASFFMTRIYKATAIILPVMDESSTGITTGLTSTFLEQFGMSGLGSSSSNSSDVFEAVLKSNDLAADVLERYNYFSMMGVPKYGENIVIKSFTNLVQVTQSKNDPSLSVSIESDDPIFASDIANSYVKELDKYNLNNSYTSAQYLREYIEKRMEEADRELDQAQVELREFQEKNRAISISDQAEATLKVLSDMEAQRVALEVEMASKEKFYKGPHIELEQLKAQIDAIQKNINRLTESEESSIGIEREGGKIEFYIPLSSVPGLNFEESKLLLKVKAKTGVVTLLTTQLEQAKLDEAKDMPTINIMESAYPPEMPIKPRKKLNVILSLVVSLFLGIFIVFFMEFMQRMDEDPESAPKWREMKNGFADIFKFLRRYGRRK